MIHSIRSASQLAAADHCTIISARSAQFSRSRDCFAQESVCMLALLQLCLKIIDGLGFFIMFAIAHSCPKKVIASLKVP